MDSFVQPASPRVVPGALLRVAPLTGLAAAAVNVALYFGAKSLGMLPDTVLVNGQPLPLIAVILSSILPVLVAAGIFALLGRFTKHPVRNFTLLSVVLVLLSLASPFASIPGVPVTMAVVLNGMHVVVAAFTVYAFRRYATAGAAA